MNDQSPDELTTSALNILIAVCDRVLGGDSPVARELRHLLVTPDEDGWAQAVKAFNLLPGTVRQTIADQSDLVATAYHQPSVEIRKQFPELFNAQETVQVSRHVWPNLR